MFAIVAIGFAALVVAARYAWRGELRLLGPVRWLLVALIASGCFGFFVDLQKVMHYASVGLDAAAGPGAVTSEQRSSIVLEGLHESLNTLTAAFAFALLAALLVAIGQWRRAQPGAASEPSRVVTALGGLL